MDWDKLVLFRKSRDSATGFIAVKSIDMDSFGTGKARAEAAVWKLVNKLENCNERLKRLGLDVTSSEDLVAKAPGSDPTVGTKMPDPEVTKKSSRKRKREAAGETGKVKKFKKTPPATLAGEIEVEHPIHSLENLPRKRRRKRGARWTWHVLKRPRCLPKSRRRSRRRKGRKENLKSRRKARNTRKGRKARLRRNRGKSKLTLVLKCIFSVTS